MDWRSLLKLDSNQPAPLYHQLKEGYRAALEKLKPGAPLPSETQCMKFARVSRATVRKAVGELVQEGVLYTRHGSGTFASMPSMTARRDPPEGFSEMVRRLRKTPATQILSVDRITPASNIASELGLKPRAEVFALERLRLVDGEPAIVERAHLPVHLFPDLPQQNLAGSLHQLIEERFGLNPEMGWEMIFAVNADRRLAQLLRVPMALALIASVRVIQGSNGVALASITRHARPDICSYRLSLDSGPALTIRSGTDSLVNLETRFDVEPVGPLPQKKTAPSTSPDAESSHDPFENIANL